MVRLASFFVLASLAIAGLCAPWNNDQNDKCEKRPEPGDDVKKCGDRFKEIITFDDKCHDLFGLHFDDNKEIHDKDDPWFDNFSHEWKDNSDGMTQVFVEIIAEIKVSFIFSFGFVGVLIVSFPRPWVRRTTSTASLSLRRSSTPRSHLSRSWSLSSSTSSGSPSSRSRSLSGSR